MNIFWEDLYNNKNLKELYEELMWISGIKPFECVGTNEEVIYAMYLSHKKYVEKNNSEKPYILQIFEKSVLPNLDETEIRNLEKKLLSHYEMTNIPEEFRKFYWE